MVHRDLKPANLMLDPRAAASRDTTWDATVKILDIGLGRELFDEAAPGGQIETQLTVEGAVLGTPDYLAPEQARDARTADIRADIYSLGCVLYHCLTGQAAVPRNEHHDADAPARDGEAAPLASLVSDVPAGLQAVLDRMLAKVPDNRYPTPAEAAEALRPFLVTGGTARKPPRSYPSSRRGLKPNHKSRCRTISLPRWPSRVLN